MTQNERELPQSRSLFLSIFLSLIKLMVAVFTFGVLAIILLPGMDQARNRSHLQMELQNARFVSLGLRMYPADHDGEFPNQTLDGNPLINANEAFRTLLPGYIPKKNLFFSTASHWTPYPPDDLQIPGKSPEAGENHFAYVPNLTDTSNQRFPLIATGFPKNSPGVYSADYQKKDELGLSGVVVVRLDGSGKLEQPSDTDYRVYDSDGTNEKVDIFKPSPNWLRPDQAPLNPEG